MISKVRLEFWMADRLGFDQPGPLILEEPLEDGESLRSLLTRLAGRIAVAAGVVVAALTV